MVEVDWALAKDEMAKKRPAAAAENFIATVFIYMYRKLTVYSQNLSPDSGIYTPNSAKELTEGFELDSETFCAT